VTSSHTEYFYVSVSETKFFQIACHVLETAGYAFKRTGQQFREISAADKGSRKLGRGSKPYDYDVHISWEKLIDYLHVTTVVAEKGSGNQNTECQNRCSVILSRILTIAQKQLSETVAAPVPDTYGSARWANSDDIAKAQYYLASPEPQRFLLAPINEGFIALTENDTYTPVLVCGPPGAGKSTGFIIPNICKRLDTNMIVTEATTIPEELPDVYLRTAGYRHAHGHEIYYFNPTDMSSTRINPLDQVRLAPPHDCKQKAQELAYLLVQHTAEYKEENPFWNNSSRQLLIALILHVAAGPKRCAHFGTIRTLLGNGPEGLATLMQNSPSESAAQEYRAFYNLAVGGKHDETAKNIMLTLYQHLASWFTEQVVTLTAKTDFDVNRLHEQTFTFYLSVPSWRNDLKPLTALLFNYLLSISLRRKETQYPLALFLDEFTNFGYIPNFPNFVNTVRKEEIPVVLGMQHVSQLEIYGSKADSIWNACRTRVFFRPNDDQSPKMMSGLLGKKTIVRMTPTEGGRMIETEIAQELMSEAQVRMLPKDKVIIFTESVDYPLLLDKFRPDKFDPESNEKNYPVPRNDYLDIDETACDCGRQDTPVITPAPAPALAQTPDATSPFSITADQLERANAQVARHNQRKAEKNHAAASPTPAINNQDKAKEQPNPQSFKQKKAETDTTASRNTDIRQDTDKQEVRRDSMKPAPDPELW
jgi:type IV secretory pathway TraG/TraD family ATPase VirD4